MRALPRLQLRSLAGFVLPALVACTDTNRGSILAPDVARNVAGAQGVDVERWQPHQVGLDDALRAALTGLGTTLKGQRDPHPTYKGKG